MGGAVTLWTRRTEHQSAVRSVGGVENIKSRWGWMRERGSVEVKMWKSVTHITIPLSSSPLTHTTFNLIHFSFPLPPFTRIHSLILSTHLQHSPSLHSRLLSPPTTQNRLHSPLQYVTFIAPTSPRSFCPTHPQIHSEQHCPGGTFSSQLGCSLGPGKGQVIARVIMPVGPQKWLVQGSVFHA